MLHRRFLRRVTALFVVWSLLFSQLALAQYVCPAQAGPAAMAAMLASGQPCEGMDTDQPALCHQHSADPATAVDAVKLSAAGQPATVQVLALPLLWAADVARPMPPAAHGEARPPPGPVFLTTRRLRV